MLIPNQIIEVTLSNSNIKHFRSLGYIEPVRDKIMVHPEELPPGSHKKIKIICDCCGNEFERENREYRKRHNEGKDYCIHCAFSNKTKFTNIKKYGHESAVQNEHIQEKIKATNLKKYSCENPFSNDEIKEKIKATNLEKYGDSIASRTIKVKEKIKETVREKYGCDSVLQSNEIKEKICKTNLERYGSENVFASKEIQEKIKTTNLERYGVPISSQSEKVKEKMKETMINRYGVEYAMQSEEIMAKAKETFYKNNSIPTSIQQKQVYDILTNLYPNNDIHLNYPYGRCSLDIALFINNKKIDIEYDGWYWHQNLQHDRKRDEFLKSNGWNILRIKGSHKIPTEVQLNEALNRLIYENYHYTEIILSDWEKLNLDKKEGVAS